MLLALDTATASITVCVYDEARDVVLASRAETGTMKHGELLAPAISAVVAEAGLAPRDLTGIAVGVGPGPYTGLRVGVVTAKTLGYVLGVPVTGVSTLDALALGAAGELAELGERRELGEVGAELDTVAEFLVATDARRREVFFGRYDRTGRRIGPLEVAKPADVPVGQLPVAGRGAVLYPEAFPRSFGPLDPSAVDVARLVARAGAELFPGEPIYLRRPDAVAQASPKPVS